MNQNIGIVEFAPVSKSINQIMKIANSSTLRTAVSTSDVKISPVLDTAERKLPLRKRVMAKASSSLQDSS
jgi:hypothetical protein